MRLSSRLAISRSTKKASASRSVMSERAASLQQGIELISDRRQFEPVQHGHEDLMIDAHRQPPPIRASDLGQRAQQAWRRFFLTRRVLRADQTGEVLSLQNPL